MPDINLLINKRYIIDAVIFKNFTLMTERMDRVTVSLILSEMKYIFDRKKLHNINSWIGWEADYRRLINFLCNKRSIGK